MNSNQLKRRKRRRKFIIRTTLKFTPAILMLVGAGAYALYSLHGEFDGYNSYNNLFNKVKKEYVDETVNLEEETYETETTEDVNNYDSLEIDYPNIVPEVELSRTSSELYDMGYDVEIVNFDELHNSYNEDANAWLTIDGTKIDLPIVDCEDPNNEYYLNHDITGKDSKYGTLFLDYNNNSFASEMEDLSDVSCIYGHNMKNGSMFGQLTNYKSQSFYNKHPFGVLSTSNGDIYKLDIFAGVIISADEEIPYRTDFVDEEEYKAYYEYLKMNSTFDSDIDIEFGDKIVALVTCSYEKKNNRYVVYARMTKQLKNNNEYSNNVKKNTLK